MSLIGQRAIDLKHARKVKYLCDIGLPKFIWVSVLAKQPVKVCDGYVKIQEKINPGN